MSQQFAAVGSDGVKLVVWGLGATPEAARADGASWLLPHGDPEGLDVYPITPEQAATVRDGDVSWPVQPLKVQS